MDVPKEDRGSRTAEYLEARDKALRNNGRYEPLTPPNLPSEEELAARRAALEQVWPHRVPSDRDRRNTPLAERILQQSLFGFIMGATMGAILGAKKAGLRYRAENAHRLPTETVGWFFYHKSKNYNAMFEGIKEAARRGPVIAVGMGLYARIEETIDNARGTRDFASSMIAGTVIATFMNFKNRLPWGHAARVHKYTLLLSGTYGLLGDGIELMLGNEVTWVSYLQRQFKKATAGTSIATGTDIKASTEEEAVH